MVRLLECPSCARHVRAGETACPFCAHDLEGVEPRALAPLPTDLTRAAALFIGATAIAGCGKEPAPQPQPPTPTHQLAAPAYGLPPQDLEPPRPQPIPPDVEPDAGKDAGKK